ncbi:MAG: family 10 glycosylhydrolase [Pirellulales bacterium]|nr:family 10 glycosylhydrolase [Pirellulales bacterium]
MFISTILFILVSSDPSFEAPHPPNRVKEVRAAWNHSGTGAYPGDWERSCRVLEENGFTLILPNMVWGGIAHYPSKILPHSKTFRKYGDQIAQCLAATKRHGIEVHVWKVNYNLATAPKDFVEKMHKAGRTQRSVAGKPTNWLCPSHPENQRLERNVMLEVIREYPVAGIHFDYIRYPDREHCYCPGCRERFEADSGKKVARWPQDCYSGPRKEEYNAWRCRQTTQLVATVSREARKIRPGIKISAAVYGGYPQCRASVAQDWPEWIKSGYLDFVCPMDYTANDQSFQKLVENQLRLVGGRIPVYPGIGASATRPPLTPERVAEQIRLLQRLGARGFTLFELNLTTAETLLPGLSWTVRKFKDRAVP